VLLIPKRHRQTDGQTDRRLTVASPRSALASRGKNNYSHSFCHPVMFIAFNRMIICHWYITILFRSTAFSQQSR